MGLKEFFMPREKNDRAVVDAPESTPKMAEPLKAGIDNLERASNNRRPARAIAIAQRQRLRSLKPKRSPHWDAWIRLRPICSAITRR
jgi:hypothetical protein